MDTVNPTNDSNSVTGVEAGVWAVGGVHAPVAPPSPAAGLHFPKEIHS